MQNQKLASLLHKLEGQQNQLQDDQFVSINDELAKNIRAVYGAGNGSCSNNNSCDNNGTCNNNPSCNGNGTCEGKVVIIIDQPIGD